MVANTTHSTQPENWPASFSLRPGCDNYHAWSTLGVRKTKVLSKFDRRACNADKTCKEFRGIFPRRRTYHARGFYFPLAFNVRVNKRGVSALPPCVLPTSKMRGEYYYRTCEVSHTQTTNVFSTIKRASEVQHWDMLRCIVLLYKSVLPIWRTIVLLNDSVLLTFLLRFSYFVSTISENVRFTCNSRTIIPLIVCDRSRDLTCSLILPTSKKAYRPLAGLTFWARHTHSLSTYYILPLRFNFHPATTPRQTGTPSPHDL